MSLSAADLSSELESIFNSAGASGSLVTLEEVGDQIITAFLTWLKSAEINLSGSAVAPTVPPTTTPATGQSLNPNPGLVDAAYGVLYAALLDDFDSDDPTGWPAFSAALMIFIPTLLIWSNEGGWTVADAIISPGVFSFAAPHIVDEYSIATIGEAADAHANEFYNGVIGSTVSSIIGGVFTTYVGAPVGSSIS
jgi:hypothetical protein|tara:strand:+ start:1381 stop:1962 length:582 start_codon:yes stop_codon:yes gene_type:complete